MPPSDVGFRGIQCLYVQDPAYLTKLGYPNGAQAGFLTGGPNANGDYPVRYWRIENGEAVNDLRTKSCSEMTSPGNLLWTDTVPQAWVEEALKEIFKDEHIA